MCLSECKPSEKAGLKVANVLKSKMYCRLLLPTSFAMHSKRVANWAKGPSMRAHLQDAKRDEEGLQIKTTSPDGGLRYK